MTLKSLCIWIIALPPFLLAGGLPIPPANSESIIEEVNEGEEADEGVELPEYTTSGSGLIPTEPGVVTPSPLPSPEITMEKVRRALKDYCEDYVTGTSKKQDYLFRFFQEIDNMSDALAQKYYDNLNMGGDMLNEFLNILINAMDQQAMSSSFNISYILGAGAYSSEELDYLTALQPDLSKDDLQIRYTISTAHNPVSSISGVSQDFETILTMFAREYNKYKVELNLTVNNDSPSTIYLRDIYVSDALRSNPGAYLLSEDDSYNILKFNGSLVSDLYKQSNNFSWPNNSGQFTEWKILGNDIDLSIYSGDTAVISYVFWFEADVGTPYGYKDLPLFNALNSCFAASFSNSADKYHTVNYSGSQLPGTFDIPPDPSDWEAVERNFAFITDSALRMRRGLSYYPINITISGGDHDYRLPVSWLTGKYQLLIDSIDWTGNTSLHISGSDLVMTLDWGKKFFDETARSGPSSYEYSGRLTLFRPDGSEVSFNYPIYFFNPNLKVNISGDTEILNNISKTFEILMSMSGLSGTRSCHLNAQLSESSPQVSRIIPISNEHLNDTIDFQAALPFGYKMTASNSGIDFSNIDNLINRANSTISENRIDALQALSELSIDLTQEVNIEIGYSNATVWQRAEAAKENSVTVTPRPLIGPTPVPYVTVNYERPTRPPAPSEAPYPGIGDEVSIDSHQWIIFKYVITNNKTWAMLVKRDYLPDEPAAFITPPAAPTVVYEDSNVQAALTQWYINEPLPLIKTYATEADNLQYNASDQFSTPSGAVGGVKNIMFTPSFRELYDNAMLVTIMQGKVPSAAVSPSNEEYGFWTRTQYGNSTDTLMYSLADYTASDIVSTVDERWLRPAVWVDAEIFMQAPIQITNTPTNTPTYTPTNTPSNTPTITPTNTPTPSPTPAHVILVAQKLSGNSNTSVFFDPDNTIWACGNNNYGQCGSGPTAIPTPVKINAISDVTAVMSGINQIVALKSDGTVWAWGSNSYGELGDGTTIARATPLQVSGLSDIIKVSAGLQYNAAIKSDGTVWTWGSNYYGQLGDGTTTNRLTPVQVGGLSGVISIATGNSHTAALKSDGTVWAWGYNYDGQLGDGTQTNRHVPVQANGLSDVVSIAVGIYHTVALKSDGTVWVCGGNQYGELGDGTTTRSLIPKQISSLSGINSISAGHYLTVALKSNGTVWTCGHNYYGQLGDGTATNNASPIQVSGLTDVTSIVTGMNHTIAGKTDGTLWAWGRNDMGQLGDGATTNRRTPVQVTIPIIP